MYAVYSPLLSKTHGGWGGELITFLGLHLGRRSHQGRNFHLLSYIPSPALIIALHSPLFLRSCSGTASCKTWTHGLTCPDFRQSSPLFLFLRQQTSNSWSVHWNMLHTSSNSMNRRPIKFETNNGITWYNTLNTLMLLTPHLHELSHGALT